MGIAQLMAVEYRENLLKGTKKSKKLGQLYIQDQKVFFYAGEPPLFQVVSRN